MEPNSEQLTRITLGLVLVIALMAVIGYVGLNEAQRMAATERAQQARAIEVGAELFEANCRGCHGIKGEGIQGVAPALNSRHFFTERLKEVGFEGTLRDYVQLTIAAGRPAGSSQWAAKMPTWSQDYGGPLRDDQVEALTAFILNWESTALAAAPTPTPIVVAQATPRPGDPEKGRQIFAANCAACHGTSGEGGVGPALKDNEFIKTSDDAAIREVIKEGRPETLMPSWKDKLTAQEIEGLIAFLKTWQD